MSEHPQTRPYIIRFFGPKPYAQLAFAAAVEPGIAVAFAEGLGRGGLPNDAKLYPSGGDMIIGYRAPNSPDGSENYYPIFPYYPDHRMFWELLAGNASQFEIDAPSNFIEMMASWFVQRPNDAQLFVADAILLPEGHYPLVQELLDRIIEVVDELMEGIKQGDPEIINSLNFVVARVKTAPVH